MGVYISCMCMSLCLCDSKPKVKQTNIEQDSYQKLQVGNLWNIAQGHMDLNFTMSLASGFTKE